MGDFLERNKSMKLNLESITIDINDIELLKEDIRRLAKSSYPTEWSNIFTRRKTKIANAAAKEKFDEDVATQLSSMNGAETDIYKLGTLLEFILDNTVDKNFHEYYKVALNSIDASRIKDALLCYYHLTNGNILDTTLKKNKFNDMTFFIEKLYPAEPLHEILSYEISPTLKYYANITNPKLHLTIQTIHNKYWSAEWELQMPYKKNKKN